MQTSAKRRADQAPTGSSATLTIDRSRLRDLYLPLEAEYREDVDRLDHMARKLATNPRRKRDYSALSKGHYRSQTYHYELVQQIRERGGLLHIGAPRVLQ
nr:hypothetical protein [Variovorax boronicumulans]